MATDGNPAVQMMLPMAEMVGWLRKGVGELVRQAGLQLMELLMQEEVRELVGERSQRRAERTANRWDSEQGHCVVMGQKVPVKRPRVRTVEEKEVRLGSYELFHRGAHLFGRDDVPRKEHHLPRPLTPEQDQLIQQELLRRNDFISNVLLLLPLGTGCFSTRECL